MQDFPVSCPSRGEPVLPVLVLPERGGLVRQACRTYRCRSCPSGGEPVLPVLLMLWAVLGEPPEYDGTNDDVLEPFLILEDVLIELIKH